MGRFWTAPGAVTGTSDRFCYVKEINGRRIKVVVESADHDQVVTAYDQLQPGT